MKNKLPWLYLTLIILVFGICIPHTEDTVYADENNISYVKTVYNERNGLPTGEANTVLQTSEGYVWTGSYGGLIRYDGTNFRNFSKEGAIVSSSIRALYEDSKGRLWIGTNDAGIFVYENDAFLDIPNPEDNSFLCIRGFTEDKNGTIYAASSSGIATVNDDGKLDICMDEEVAGQTVYGVATDSYNRIWGAMNDGKCAVLKDGSVIKTVSSDEVFESNEIYCVASDKAGNIYLGSDDKMVAKVTFSSEALEASAFQVSYYTLEETSTHNSIRITQDNDILVAGLKGAAWISPEGDIHEFREKDNASSVNSMDKDYEGNIWLASSSYGVIKYSRGCYTSPNEKAGIEDLTVNSVVKGNNRYYIATDQELLMFDGSWNPLNNSFTDMLDGVRVRQVICDSKGRVWAATYSQYGVVCYDESNDKISIYNDENGLTNTSVRTLYELADGSIAAGTQGGLNIIDETGVSVSYDDSCGMDNSSVLCILQDKAGVIYVGSDGDGIYSIENGNVKNYGFSEGLGEGVVLRMLEDAESGGYFVSAGSSLYYWDKTGFKKLGNFNKDAGSIFDMYERDGRLWVLQNNGILSIDKKQLLAGEKADTKSFGFSYGLTGSLNANTWNCLDETGTLYMATRAGVSEFRFKGVEHCLPKGIINDVNVDGIAYEHPESLKLTSGTQRITIDFAVLAYEDSDNYILTYYLEGFDKNKMRADNNKNGAISYTNLPGGSYVFCLDITNADNPEDSYSYEIKIDKDKKLTELPVFWVMCFVLIFLFLITISVIYIYIRTVRIKKRQEEYKKITVQSLQTFAKTIDAKDKYTIGHSIRVAWYSRELARRLGLSEAEQEKIYYVGLVHDIGKIGIPDKILNKEGKLTDEEFDIIRKHPVIGGEILKDFTAIEGITDGVKYHHERYDGKGYCEQKKGEDIPLFARIIGVADAYDAMASDRCYRSALPREVIEKELKEGSGKQFDAKIVPHMLKMISEGVAPVGKNEETEI